ncbi:MAG TPA: LacI family DNA-binding transcriptional regulator, partial [Candidatus Sumerlaeota bacterium]|nr:LacI family DNA-binding transcriptional regulator [Candidatus Sumerlaeota bacterium]
MAGKESNRLSTPPGRITLHDVAREAEVSAATVSKVLSGAKGAIRISKQTRERVMAVARRMNYIPNASAQALRRGSLSAIGLYFPFGLHPWVSSAYSQLTRHISILLEEERHSLVIMINPPPRKKAEPARFPSFLYNQGVDGVICVHQVPEALLEELRQRKMPYVLLNCDTGYPENCVDADERWVMQQSLQYVYDLGHRRIIFAGRSTSHPSYDIKREVYVEFMKRKGLPALPDVYEITDPLSDERGDFGEKIAERILRQAERPTAIVAYNDITALALIHAFRDRGISIPEEISIVGCDDIHESLVARPRLTTFRFPA